MKNKLLQELSIGYGTPTLTVQLHELGYAFDDPESRSYCSLAKTALERLGDIEFLRDDEYDRLADRLRRYAVEHSHKMRGRL